MSDKTNSSEFGSDVLAIVNSINETLPRAWALAESAVQNDSELLAMVPIVLFPIGLTTAMIYGGAVDGSKGAAIEGASYAAGWAAGLATEQLLAPLVAPLGLPGEAGSVAISGGIGLGVAFGVKNTLSDLVPVSPGTAA